MTDPKPPIPRLLAGKDQLSRVEQEQILARVLAQTQAEAPATRRGFGWVVGLFAAAAAVVGALFLANLSPEPPEFVARGGGPDFSVACVEALPCGPGGRLRWFVRSTPKLPNFAAFAQRTDGTILWYFPENEGGSSLDLGAHAHSQSGELDLAIALGQEHGPGTYKVIGMFSPTPMTRGAIRAAYLGPREPGAGLVFIESSLVLR